MTSRFLSDFCNFCNTLNLAQHSALTLQSAAQLLHAAKLQQQRAARLGKKMFMIVGLLVSAAFVARIAFAQSFSWLIVLVVATNLAMAMFSPAALGLLSENAPFNWRSTAMGLYGGMCKNTGIIAASAWGPRPTFLIGTIAAAAAPRAAAMPRFSES